MSIHCQNAGPLGVGLIRFALVACVAASGLAAQSTVWQPLTPASLLTPQPGVRRSPAMAYDSARDLIVLVGGRINQNGSNVLPQETWEFDGAEWELAGPVGPVRSVIRSGVRAVWRHTPGGYRMCEVGESQLGGSVQT
jgi:hypothetical protein